MMLVYGVFCFLYICLERKLLYEKEGFLLETCNHFYKQNRFVIKMMGLEIEYEK